MNVLPATEEVQGCCRAKRQEVAGLGQHRAVFGLTERRPETF